MPELALNVVDKTPLQNRLNGLKNRGVSVIQAELINSIKKKSASVGVVGLGYVGLPLILRFIETGFKVVGFDIDTSKIEALNHGKSYIGHIPNTHIQIAREKGLTVTADYSRAKDVDVLIICVPTPLNKYREPDLSFVINTVESLVPHLRQGQLVSLESTTYPGTTDEELLPRIESKGFKVGKDCFLVFSPEREDPGNASFSTKTIPKIVGGHTTACLEVGLSLYGQIIDKVVPVSSTRAAELTKLLENIHRAVNIGLVNEMKMVADKMNIDIHEVINAAATKPFGFVPYYPGPGLGGHCIPIDPFYLTWKAREYGLNTKFIEVAGEINASMPDYVVSKINSALNANKKAINGSRILMLGIAYKKNVDDMRESPSVVLMEKLRSLGAMIDYSDPHIPKFPKLREHRFDLTSVPLEPKRLSSYDCAVLATDHDSFDYELIKKNVQLIVDTRGRFLETSPQVVRA